MCVQRASASQSWGWVEEGVYDCIPNPPRLPCGAHLLLPSEHRLRLIRRWLHKASSLGLSDAPAPPALSTYPRESFARLVGGGAEGLLVAAVPRGLLVWVGKVLPCWEFCCTCTAKSGWVVVKTRLGNLGSGVGCLLSPCNLTAPKTHRRLPRALACPSGPPKLVSADLCRFLFHSSLQGCQHQPL